MARQQQADEQDPEGAVGAGIGAKAVLFEGKQRGGGGRERERVVLVEGKHREEEEEERERARNCT